MGHRALIGGAVDPGGTGTLHIFLSGTQSPADRGRHGVQAAASGLDDLIGRIVDNVAVGIDGFVTDAAAAG